MNIAHALLPLAASAVALAVDPRAVVAQESPGAPAALAPSAPPAFVALEMLRLLDGRVLWGEIVDHDSAGFVVHRLDTRGRVRLAWSHLDPSQGLELQRRFGYVEFEQEEIMVDAAIIPLVDGTQMIGVIEQSTPDDYHVKTRTGLLVLPRERVAGAVTPTRVPARDIYSRQELYESERSKYATDLASGGAAATDANLALAEHCEAILDFVKAVEHYEAAIALGAADPALAGRLDSARRRAAAQIQVDTLDTIDRLRRQGAYPEAVRELALFPQAYPTSPLMEEWAKLNQRVLADRERDVLREARDRWFHWLSKGAREAAKTMDFEAAQAYAEEGLGQFVLAQVTADVQKLWPEASQADVRDAFARRTGSRVRGVTYGQGTFLLGKERANAKPQEEAEEEAGPLDGLARQRQELQERMERFLASARQQAGGGAAGAEAQIDPEEYWKGWSLGGRADWIVAYYAEFGGDLEMVRVTVEPHAECGGTGFLEIISAGAGGGVAPRLVPDPNCNGVGVKRRIKFR
jgi:hypothetical protein